MTLHFPILLRYRADIAQIKEVWGEKYLHSPTNRSWDIKFRCFKAFLAKKVHFSHFCWSEGYTLYETLIQMCPFWFK